MWCVCVWGGGMGVCVCVVCGGGGRAAGTTLLVHPYSRLTHVRQAQAGEAMPVYGWVCWCVVHVVCGVCVYPVCACVYGVMVVCVIVCGVCLLVGCGIDSSGWRGGDVCVCGRCVRGGGGVCVGMSG